MTGTFYFVKTNGYNFILINTGERWFDTDKDGEIGYFAGVDLYGEENDDGYAPTVERLKNALKKGEEDGTFDFGYDYFEQIYEIKECRGMSLDDIEDAIKEQCERTGSIYECDYYKIGTAEVDGPRVQYVVYFHDYENGATSPIDTIEETIDYTAEDYIDECKMNDYDGWTEMFDHGEITLEEFTD